MKIIIYLSGIISINLFFVGALMKIYQMPFAGELIVIGLGIFAIVFLPLAVKEAYALEQDKTLLPVYISGLVSAMICIIGAIFKIQHFQGANILLIIGIPLPFVFFLPVYLYNNIKSKSNSNRGFISVLFLMAFITIFTAFLSIRH
jgi:hypothetical protein